jgi:hypothetical protein
MKVVYLFHEAQLFTQECTSTETPPASASHKINIIKHCIFVNFFYILGNLTKCISYFDDSAVIALKQTHIFIFRICIVTPLCANGAFYPLFTGRIVIHATLFAIPLCKPLETCFSHFVFS